jgi:hypothetical protein
VNRDRSNKKTIAKRTSLAFGLIGNPITSFVAFVQASRPALSLATWRALTTPELDSYAPGVVITDLCEIVVNFGWLAYGIAVAVLFFKKRRSFPFHFTVYALGVVTFAVLDHLAGTLLAPDRESSTVPILRTIMWAAIWISYVRKSRRVASTFTKPGPQRRRARQDDDLAASEPVVRAHGLEWPGGE